MGCNEAKTLQNSYVHPEINHKFSSTQETFNSNNLQTKALEQKKDHQTNKVQTQNKIFDVAWDEFSQQSNALEILNKQQLSSRDFKFLLQNQIWKQQWFVEACKLLNINSSNHQLLQNIIMKFFLTIKLKQAQFIEKGQNDFLFCQKCYENEQNEPKQEEQKIRSEFFSRCQICKGVGWVHQQSGEQNQLKNKINIISLRCSCCQKQINSFKNQIQCIQCNTLGYKWNKKS